MNKRPPTYQKTYLWRDGDRPEDFTRLDATLIHPECKTGRSFRVFHSLLDVLSKKVKGMGIETHCEVCKRRSGVLITWKKLTFAEQQNEDLVQRAIIRVLKKKMPLGAPLSEQVAITGQDIAEALEEEGHGS